jgi:hypothetical protein
MPRLSYLEQSEPAPKKAQQLKPFLLLALTLAVLAFCATLWLR